MKDNQPVPDNIEREKKVEYMGWVENPWLKRREKWDARIIIRVP